MSNKLGAIILAAGKGSRMNSKKINKVALHLGDKPMIMHTVELLEELNIDEIIVVVGFAKNSVTDILGDRVSIAEQSKRLGTAHAVYRALPLVKNSEDILVLNGDDSAFYSKEVIEKLVQKHKVDDSEFTFLTIDTDNPHGLGRVVRDKEGNVEAIVEEKDATDKQRKIKEVNPGCYIFKVSFIKKYLPKVKKSPVTGEYYLTSLIDMGIHNKEKIETLKAGSIKWRGVNTKDELEEAEKLLTSA
jgi:bifunctional UDP-N-acetylglucosamine pyrophosphorylase/glucosamine-1-phosphate N-acetyltransferase